MGRLIDADALAAEVSAWKKQQHSMNIDYSTGYRSALSAVEGMIADAPMVEAIPVEWLQEQRKAFDSMARGGHHSAWIIKALILQWQNEREENNEHV